MSEGNGELEYGKVYGAKMMYYREIGKKVVYVGRSNDGAAKETHIAFGRDDKEGRAYAYRFSSYDFKNNGLIVNDPRRVKLKELEELYAHGVLAERGL